MHVRVNYQYEYFKWKLNENTIVALLDDDVVAVVIVALVIKMH